MPEPSGPPWRVEPKLEAQTIRTLVANREAVVIRCDACRNLARWVPSDLERRFHAHMGVTFARIAPRLRCSRCRSEWVRVSLHRPAPALPRGAPS
jgi:transcriptional regulator GlxA family with amidase domain